MARIDASLSVVIPLFNKRSTIIRAINSVMAQLVAPDAIIVIDDGSCDGGAELVRNTFDNEISLIQQQNSGVSVARNAGLKLARTEFVAFLDADDFWEPNFVKNFRDSLLSCSFGIWACRYYFEGVSGRRLAFSSNGPWPKGVLCKTDYFKYSLKSPIVTSSSVVVRRTALAKIGGFPVGVTVGEDLITWARLLDDEVLYISSDPSAVYCFDPKRNEHISSMKVSPPEELLQFFQARSKSGSYEQRIYYLVLLSRALSALQFGAKSASVFLRLVRISCSVLISREVPIKGKGLALIITARAGVSIMQSIIRSMKFK
ncbi:glycosyltransferase family 2 protein [Luminiphilus sp.]|nr:glycosyltransferase family 2 protein [Luminiphilus sp.]